MSGMENDGCACRICCVACASRHPPSNFNSSGLSFFKVMTGDFTSFLEIPWRFVGGMKDGLDALLIGLNGRLWPTKLCVSKGHANFGNGWESFVTDNCLNDGDIVVFRHVTRTDFVVQIFRANDYRKQCAKEEVPSEVCNHGEKSCACFEVIHNEDNSEDDIIKIAREEQDTKLELAGNPAAVKSFAEPDLALEMEHEVSRLRSRCIEKKRKLRKVQEAQYSYCEAKKNKLKKVQKTQNALVPTKNRKNFERFVAEFINMLIKENPKFVLYMSRSSVTGGYRLSIPINFGRRWLQNRRDIVLNSSELSNSWVLKIVSYAKYYGISSGWRPFVLAHNLKDNDACIFELVDKKHCIFKVHVKKWEDFQKHKLLTT